MSKPDEDLLYDQDEAVNFIQKRFASSGQSEVTKEVIRKLLDADEDYMRSKGIIED